MTNKKDYFNKCFSPNWLEVDLERVQTEQTAKEVTQSSSVDCESDYLATKKEVRLESKRRKDLDTLLKELEEIKENIEKVAEKQHRLTNLMSFYTGEFVQ